MVIYALGAAGAVYALPALLTGRPPRPGPRELKRSAVATRWWAAGWLIIMTPFVFGPVLIGRLPVAVYLVPGWPPAPASFLVEVPILILFAGCMLARSRALRVTAVATPVKTYRLEGWPPPTASGRR